MSLFTRVINREIGLHMLQALIEEVTQSTRISGADAAQIMNISGQEITDINTIVSKLSTDKQYRRFFNYPCLCELKVTEPYDYTNETNFWLALDTF